MGELQVIAKQKIGVIEFNFEELKGNLSEMMELYKDAKFTEETSASAKKEAATLKKIKKALSDRRIEVKKEFMKPYDDFEAKVKELTALIDEPIILIEDQVKVFEEKKLGEKKQKIQETYNELIGEFGEYLPLVKIYNSKWENVGTSIRSIRDEIEQVVSATEMAVATINGMNSEAVPKAIEQYKKDLSLANAISYITQYDQQKAEILAKAEAKRKEEEERKRIAEERRIREEERQRIIEDERKKVAEENRIREEERQRLAEIERAREEERLKIEAESKKLALEESELICDAICEEPFADDLEEPFEVDIEGPFEEMEDDLDEAPFVTSDRIQSCFTVVGTFEELEQLEMYLDSVGMEFEREDD